MPGQRGLGRDGELRCGRAVGDDGEPDDERLDAERARDAGRAADQPLRAPVEDRDAEDQRSDVEGRCDAAIVDYFVIRAR